MTRTQCIPQRMDFQRLGCRDVTASPDGGAITSDAGALLLREAERRVKLIEGLVDCFEDGRDPRRVEHELGALLRQRVHVAQATGHPHIEVFHHAWRNLRAGPEGEAAV